MKTVAIIMLALVTLVAGRQQCPCGKPVVKCLVNPCQFARCPKFPAASCVPNYCGGCDADWFVNKRRVTC